MTAVANLSTCLAEVERAERDSGRRSGSVRPIVVTKTIAPERIAPLLASGHRRFGENRVQEAEQKWPSLKIQYPDIELHLLGPLQKNKINKALNLFDVIQTVDSVGLALGLQHRLKDKQRCFIQVNTGTEQQKSGVDPKNLITMVETIRHDCPDLEVQGLMAIPPFDEDPRPHFQWLQKQAQRLALSELSIGMSADFQVAIACGATYIRIGTRIFGSRS